MESTDNNYADHRIYGVVKFKGEVDFFNSPTVNGKSTTNVKKLVDSVIEEEAVRELQFTQVGSSFVGNAGELLGNAITISKDANIMSVSSYGYSTEDKLEVGKVNVYKNEGGEWVPYGNEIIGENIRGYSGFSTAMSDNGTIIAVCGHYNNDGLGSCKIYEYISGIWTIMGSPILGKNAGDNFGSSVVMSSDGIIVAVSSLYNDDGGTDSGQVRVFKYNGTEWESFGNDINGEAASDNSGSGIAISSDGLIIAVGAYDNNSGGNDSGEVKIYKYNDGFWEQFGNFVGENEGDRLSTVSLSGDGTIILLGADGSYNSTGSVRAFKYENDTWSQFGQTIIGSYSGSYFGGSTSISDNGRVFISGTWTGGKNRTGYSQVYEYSDSTWNQVTSDIDGKENESRFGGEVQISHDGKTIAIGGRSASVNGTNSGIAKVYTLKMFKRYLTEKPETPNPGSSYFDVETSRLNIYDGFVWKSQLFS